MKKEDIKQVMIRLPVETHEKLKMIAKKETRSVAQETKKIITDYVEGYNDVDDEV